MRAIRTLLRRSEAVVEIERLREGMTPEEIKRCLATVERIRNSFSTERKHLAEEIVWVWQPCFTNGHFGYRFRFKRPNGSMSEIRCRQCNADRTASRPKKKPSTHPVAVAMQKVGRRVPSKKTLGKILFGLN